MKTIHLVLILIACLTLLACGSNTERDRLLSIDGGNVSIALPADLAEQFPVDASYSLIVHGTDRIRIEGRGGITNSRLILDTTVGITWPPDVPIPEDPQIDIRILELFQAGIGWQAEGNCSGCPRNGSLKTFGGGDTICYCADNPVPGELPSPLSLGQGCTVGITPSV